MSEFDRLHPRGTAARARRRSTPNPSADRDGKSALFSARPPMAASVPLGAMTVECSTCDVTTTLTARQALEAAVPSVHLPLLRRSFPSWMRCPACRRRTWVRVGLRA